MPDQQTILDSLKQPTYEQMGQDTAAQLPPTAQLLGAETTGRIAPEQLASLQGRYGSLVREGFGNNGIGTLASGIGALFLAPKVRAAEAEAAKTQLKAQNLELDAKINSNKIQQQTIDQNASKLMEIKKMDALSRIEGGTSENIQEDAKLIGATFKEDGKLKTNFDYLNEMQSKGAINFNVKDVIKHNPGLIMKLGQAFTPLTAEGFQKELNDAAKEQRLYKQSQNALTQSLGTKDPNRDNFKAFMTSQATLGGLLQKISDPVFSAANPEAVDEIMQTVILPGFQTTAKFAKENGLVPEDKVITPGRIVSAHYDGMNGDMTGIQAVAQDFNMVTDAAKRRANKPDNTPDRVKTKAPPVTVASPGQDLSKKESAKKTGLQGLLP